MEPILVADAGSATTMACLVTGPVGRPPFVPDEQSAENYWPTAVARQGDEFLTGTAAIQPGTHQGLPGGRFLLDLMAPDTELTLDGTGYPRHVLLGEMLGRLRAKASVLANREVTRLLLTVPYGVTRNDTARRGLLRAARLAGFTDTELLSAVLAAAMAPGAPRVPGGYLLVCDAGASALRLSLVRTGRVPGRDQGRVLEDSAIAELGGDRMDEAIAKDLPKRAGRRKRDTVQSWTRSQRYLAPVTRARHLLSTTDTVEVSLDTADRITVPYRRSRLKSQLSRPLDRMEEACRGMLRNPDLGRKPADSLHGVLLIGGCGVTPLFADKFGKLNVPVHRGREPQFAVLEGAVFWAQHVADRVITAMPPRPGTRDLAWEFKDRRVTLVRWLLHRDGEFASGDRLAVVRSVDDDRVKYLTADFAGIMRQHRVCELDRVDSGDVVAVAEIRRTTRADLADPVQHLDDLPGWRAAAFGQGGGELLLTDNQGTNRVVFTETGAEREFTWPDAVTLGTGSAAARDPDTGWVAGVFRQGKFEICGENDDQARSLGRYDEKRWPAIWLSADGRLACLIDGRKARVRLTDWKAGRKGKVLADRLKRDFYADARSPVAFSQDGATVILACAKKDARFRKKKRKPAELLAFHPQDGTGRTIRELPEPQTQVIFEVAPDGSRVMVAADGEAAVLVPGADSGAEGWQELWRMPQPLPLTAAGFSASGDLLVTAYQQPEGWSLVTVWDCGDYGQGPGEAEPRVRQFRAGYPVTRLLISPDDRFLVTGDDSDSTLWGLLP